MCRRCYGPINTSSFKKKPSGYDSVEVKFVELPVKRCSIRPFVEGLSEELKDDGQKLIDEYIIPFFLNERVEISRGFRFKYGSVEFKIIFCYPPIGVWTSDTKITIGKPVTGQTPLKKLQLLPTLASLSETKYNPDQIFKDYITPFFDTKDKKNKHMCNGESFLQHGVEFRVAACEPENGIVTKETVIWTNGVPLIDLKKLHILPIYETLPNREKKNYS